MKERLLGALRETFDWRKHGADWFIFWTLVVGYAAWLLSTVHDLGYSRDEGFYFQAADRYLEWFRILSNDPARAVKQSVVDRHWQVNHEHPALIKSLFALSRYWFYDRLQWFSEPGTSYRFVGILLSALSVGTVYSWGARALSREAGLFAALSFAFIPRIFYHSHLDCFDMPVLAMWMFTTHAYWRNLHSPTLLRTLWCGVLYGLLLNTKHNSWILPFPLVAHALLAHGSDITRAWSQRRLGIPKALFAMAVIGPLVFYALWPWIWFDTFDRLVEYVKFHTAHVYYNIEFLGVTYFRPPFPRSYAWLMSLATVPFIIWVVAAVGLGNAVRRLLGERLIPFYHRVRSAGFSQLYRGPEGNKEQSAQHSTFVLWGLFILASYAPWLSTSSPIFGGAKHWIIAYPFLCLFGGLGFELVARRARECFANVRLPTLPKLAAWLPKAGLALVLLVGPLVMTVHSHPWALSTYLPLVGGAPGGATMGLNRSF